MIKYNSTVNYYKMVRNYIRKTGSQSWDEKSMENAIMACYNKEMGYRKIAVSFNMPQSTLERRLKKYENTRDPGKKS